MLLILLFTALPVIAFGVGVTVGISWLTRKAFGHRLPRWVAVILFLVIAVATPLAYDAYQKNLAETGDKRNLAAISFTVLEPTTVPADYERFSVTTSLPGERQQHVEFSYKDSSKEKASSKDIFRINETAENAVTSRYCNEDSRLRSSTYSAGQARSCLSQTTSKGIRWYHGRPEYGGEQTEFAVIDGIRATIKHYYLSDTEISTIFDGLIMKKPAEIDVSKNPRNFSFLGITF